MVGWVFAVVVVTIMVTSSEGQGQLHGWDTSVCQQLGQSQNDLNHKRPLLTKQFSIRVEANILDQNFTTDIREWYDEPNNRGSLEQYDSGQKAYFIYDYNINELVLVQPQPNSDFKCTVTDLSKDPNRFIFGSKTYANGTDRIFTAAGALRFGGSQPEKYLGVTAVKGIQCDHWQSCMYWQDMDATQTVDWYFSRPEWITSREIAQIPVRCHVKGKIWKAGTSRNFEHIYEFSEFENTLDGETRRFETPQGAYCQGMKTRTKPPVPANEFSFSAEVQVPEIGKITYMKESYDHDSKLVKIEYKPSNFGGPGASKDRTTEIHDFNTGLAYVIDEVHDNCTVQMLSATGFDSVPSKGMFARIRSSSEFFFTNQTSFIEYEGMRVMRGIECDVWIANKNDWPYEDPINTTWEWYFARQEWQSNAGFQFQSQMPVGIVITMHLDPAEHFIYNIYDYDESSGNIWNYDISACYPTSKRQFYQILLQGNFTTDVLADEMYFKTFVISALCNFLAISPLRVTDIDLDHNNKYIKVTFNILDKAPFQGDIQNFPTQTPLTVAVQKLNLALQQKSFVIPIAIGNILNQINLTAIPYTDALWGYKMVTISTLTGAPDDEPEVIAADPEVERELPEVDEKEEKMANEVNELLEIAKKEDGIAEQEDDMAPMEEQEDDMAPAEDLPEEHRVYKRAVNNVNNLQLCQDDAEGYSGGALAGIAIGMLVLGFFVCFGAILLGSKYGNRVTRSQGYEMT